MVFSSRMSWIHLENSAPVSWAVSWVLQNTGSVIQASNSSFYPIFLLFLGVLLGVFLGWMFSKLFYLQRRTEDRRISVRQSRATTLWYVSEKIAPLLPDFPYSYKDLVFLGKGVDYVCFDGLAQGAVKQIVFIEIKTGKSMLNKNELLIKSAVDRWKVSWETVRL